MSLPRFRYALLFGFVVGLAIPAGVMTCARLRVLHVGEWLLFVWPSSLMLMATENLGRSPEAFGILAMSVAVNIILYVLVFSLFWCFGWATRAWHLSLRDGTTI